ncbi:hypothetical protein [Nonomuraea endophytica]|uniref:hypothetical protein n=1 Tax=Nonomuraea endophytica TaxID=714136 RepID=UPI0037CB76B2
MQLTRLASDCPDGYTCPTISKTDRGTIAVQGYMLATDDSASLSVPDGECVVEIPVEVLLEAARAYGT